MWKLLGGLLTETEALHSRALLPTVAKLIHKTITKVEVHVTVFIVHGITIRVGLLQREDLLLEAGLEVGVLEGGGQGADVGGPGRQLAAVGGHREHRDRGPRLLGGVTGAGSVLRPGREAWRGARR